MPFRAVSKEVAFAKPKVPVPNIAIDYTQHDFKFTRKWFRQRNQITWSRYLYPKFGGSTVAASHLVRMIQIGVFEGMDLVWCCQHLLKHPDSYCLAIDPWEATRKLDAKCMEAVFDRAYHNLKPWEDRVELLRGYSQDRLANAAPNDHFDLIVIDGDHNADAVYKDAVQSLRAAKVGGWLVFDDYFNRTEKANHVKAGVNRFANEYDNQIKLEWFDRHCVCFSKVE